MTNRALLLAMLSCLPGVAQAQDAAGGGATNAGSVPANISVADRFRPEYSPIGGRVGSFFLYPRVDVSAQYNSNLRAATDDEISDFIAIIRPQATLQSQWGRNALNISGYYQQALHAKTTSENFSTYGLGAGGRLDVGTATIVRGNASLDKLAEPRTDINSFSGSRSPLRYTNLSVGAGVSHSFVAFDLSADVGLQKQSFEDAVALDGTPIDLSFRDSKLYTGSLEARTRLGAGLSAIARVATNRIEYDINPINGVDRNSQSYRAELGLGLAVSRLIYGDIRFGYFKQNNFDPLFVDPTGLSFAANLLYSPTTLTSVRLTADRSVEPGGSTVTSGNVRSTGALTVDHELFRNLVLTGYGRLSHVQLQGVGPAGGTRPSADEYEVRAAAQYYANRRWRLTGTVAHIGRSSDILPTFAVNVVTLTATLML